MSIINVAILSLTHVIFFKLDVIQNSNLEQMIAGANYFEKLWGENLQ